MITIYKGDLFSHNSEAMVNTVNLVGVMGKGIALVFKNKFPENYNLYKKACDNGNIGIGNLFLTKENDITIINFPTKKHWRNQSEYSYIEKGLIDLVDKIKKYKITKLSLPLLGCGNGGLNPDIVISMIEKYLDIDGVEVILVVP